VNRTDCGCVDLNGDIVSDGCKWLVEIGFSASFGSKWIEENRGSVSDGLCISRGERRLCFGRQYMFIGESDCNGKL
jgi:hypothetical protein